MWVADTLNHRLQIFNLEGEFIKGLGKMGAGDGEFVRPMGLSFDDEGNLYVVESRGDRIQVFDPEGQFLFKFGESGNGKLQFSNIHGIYYADHHLFVADTGNYRIQKVKINFFKMRSEGQH